MDGYAFDHCCNFATLLTLVFFSYRFLSDGQVFTADLNAAATFLFDGG